MDNADGSPPRESVRWEVRDGVMWITLDDPPTRNSLSQRGSRLLIEACRIASVDEAVRVVAITGAGSAFCSGGNFKAFGAHDPDDPVSTRCSGQPSWNTLEVRAQRFELGHEAVTLLQGMGKPSVALVNGPAAGAGFALATACELRIASERASFHPAYLKIGLSPDMGIAWTLTRIVGPALASDILLLRDRIDAQEALAMGLVNRIIPEADFIEGAHAVISRLADAPSYAVYHTLQALRAGKTQPLADALKVEALSLARCFDIRQRAARQA